MAKKANAREPVSYFPVVATFDLPNNGTTFKSFKGSWRVPPPPSTDNDQAISLYIGMEPTVQADGSRAIIQPVLQWTKDDGWYLECVYLSGKPGQLQIGVRTKAVPVRPGDILDAVITFEGKNNGALAYNCQFSGVTGAGLYVATPNPFVQVGLALEDALEEGKTPGPSDFPASPTTHFEDLEVSYQDGSTARPSWHLKTDYGARAETIFHGGVESEIDILYR